MDDRTSRLHPAGGSPSLCRQSVLRGYRCRWHRLSRHLSALRRARPDRSAARPGRAACRACAAMQLDVRGAAHRSGLFACCPTRRFAGRRDRGPGGRRRVGDLAPDGAGRNGGLCRADRQACVCQAPAGAGGRGVGEVGRHRTGARGTKARGTEARRTEARGTESRGTGARGTEARRTGARSAEARRTEARRVGPRGTGARGKQAGTVAATLADGVAGHARCTAGGNGYGCRRWWCRDRGFWWIEQLMR